MSAISGSSAYYILILSGLGILLAAALARRGPAASRTADRASHPGGDRSAHPGRDRWAIASGMLVGLQGLRLLTEAWTPASIFLPLLDRLFSVLLPALLGWAALGPETGEPADRLVTGVVVASGGWFAVSAFLGTIPSEFNSSVFDEVWSLLALGIAGAVLLAILVKRPPQWGVFAGALGVLVAGDLAHIATMPFTASSAPYVLLGEALAVPLFAVGAVWSLVREPDSPAPGPAAGDAFPPWRTLSAFVEMDAADSAAAYAASLTQAVGTLLRAEYCLLLTPPSADGGLAIGAGYDTTHRKPVLGLVLEFAGMPGPGAGHEPRPFGPSPRRDPLPRCAHRLRAPLAWAEDRRPCWCRCSPKGEPSPGCSCSRLVRSANGMTPRAWRWNRRRPGWGRGFRPGSTVRRSRPPPRT